MIDRDGYEYPDPWETCPECKCGRGQDHARGCPKGKRPPVNNFTGEQRERRPIR